MINDTGVLALVGVVAVAALAGSLAAQGERITPGAMPGIEIELGGVVPTTIEHVSALFPTQRGLAAHYNGGQESRVYYPGADEGNIILTYGRVVDTFEPLERQVVRFDGDRMLVVERHDPTTGHNLVLMEAEQVCLALAGDSGGVVRSGATWVTFVGAEEIVLEGRAHRTVRHEIRGASPGQSAPPRQPKGQVAARGRWTDLATGLPVLEAVWYEGADAWLPILVLTETEVLPENVLDEEDGESGIAEHLRARLLGAQERTIPEPMDRAVVPLVAEEDLDLARIPTLPLETPPRVTVLEIVVHSGRSPVGGLRSSVEAEARAELLMRLARKRGVAFGDVARWYSDGATRTQDGIVGTYDRRVLHQDDPVVEAAFSMEVGQVSEPIRRGSDIVIVGRGELVEMCAARIIIGHRDSLRPLPGRSQRTRDEAKTVLRDILRRFEKGADFSKLARRFSEAPEATNGGRLGILAPGALDPTSEARLAATPIGSVTDIIDGRHGLVILQRLPIERIQAVIVVVSWHTGHSHLPSPHLGGGTAGEESADERSPRDAALARAKEIARELASSDVDARQLARERSDDPRAAETGGDTGPLDPHLLPPHLAPIARLPVGGVSRPIETPRGYLVVKRTR